MNDTILHPSSSLEADANAVMRDVRNALAAILEAVPQRLDRPHDIHKALGIDKNLGWRIAKVAHGRDSFGAARHLPGPAAMRTFLQAAGKRGVPRALLTKAEQAVAGVERLVEEHAGDRQSLEMMLASWATEEREAVGVAQRKKAYQANSFIWGTQARTLLRCFMIHPAADPKYADSAAIRGSIRLRRMRPQVPLVVSRDRTTDDDGTLRTMRREPLDPGGEGTPRMALLRDYCSHPLPAFRAVEGEDGYVYGELVGGGVGDKGAVTCVDGSVYRNMGPRCRTEDDRVWGHLVKVFIPHAVLILDVLVYEGLFGNIEPHVKIYGDHLRGGAALCAQDELPVDAPVIHLGAGAATLHTPDVPRYAEMIRYACDRLDWDPERFDVFRCRIEYPVMPSTVEFEFDLPESLGA